ncbi:hypothetical protein C7212DRAFT_364272 [Tuber magnatum]|uniref:Uncharacterized protein n=1 Tax=Tuber magnatum TaxID=42249 RepID=A0A317SLC0_9PEZI|nr:hypothetical protein C7212DRAFT_364272 [Tuber magnatum]
MLFISHNAWPPTQMTTFGTFWCFEGGWGHASRDRLQQNFRSITRNQQGAHTAGATNTTSGSTSMSRRVLGIRRRTAKIIMATRRAGSDCYEVVNKAAYECIDRYGEAQVYEREDEVGDGKPVALSQGNIDIDSYADDDHHWGRDRDTSIEDNDKDSDEDDGEDDDDEEDKDDDGEDEYDNEESEDNDEDDEDDYQGAGETMEKDGAGAGAEQGYHHGYRNYCGNSGHQGNDIGTYQDGIDISQGSGVLGAEACMGLGDMWYSVDIPGGQGMPRALPVEQAMAGALGNAVWQGDPGCPLPSAVLEYSEGKVPLETDSSRIHHGLDRRWRLE